MELQDIKNEISGAMTALKDTQKEMVVKEGARVDVLLKNQEDKIAEAISTLAEKAQTIDIELKGRLDAVEKLVNRSNLSTEGEKDETKSAFNEYLKKGTIDGKEQKKLIVKAMSTDNDPNGGYLVRPEYSGAVSKIIFETSPMRQLATVVNGSSDAYLINLDDDEADARWVGQGASQGETSTPELAMIRIDAKKMEAEPKVTHEQLQDSYMDVEAWLSQKQGEKFGRTEAIAFFSGEGVIDPHGILKYTALTDSTYARNGIQQVKSGTSGEVTVSGFVDLQNSLKEGYQSNAKFVMKRSTFGAVLKLKSTDNYHFLGLQPTDRGGFNMSILDKPVVFADAMPIVAANSLSIAYGDFKAGYLIYDRVGIELIRDEYTSKGFVKFYSTKRVGGGVINYEAIKLQKLTN